MPKILITGGAGFIGSVLVNHCLDAGHAVVVYDNLSLGSSRHLTKDARLKVVNGDILNKTLLESTVDRVKPEYVIHLAAIHFIPYCSAHPEEAIQINISGTQSVLNATKPRVNKGLKGVLIASSAAVYRPSETPHRESEIPAPDEIYGLTKYANEKQLEFFQRDTNVGCASLRLFNVYGPNDTNPHIIPEIAAQVREGRRELRIGNSETKRSYLYVEDAANAILAVLLQLNGGYRTFNIGSSREYNARELAAILAKIVNSPIALKSVASKRRTIDRPRLKPSLKAIRDATGWAEKWTIEDGLSAVLAQPEIAP